ncbi:type 1 glutamine amidotransferase [Natrialbaceae archaeon AArc-T1-2]|uniref:type 1 glutamine amidotransferase n=1 Tax=Natrialbaceae archaeon AArc-T1-2 TaxID=3053904 RepID=UPI00255AF259|nr:type 1 glutamine amidotransferase [Natrialbaceae archaeon AArc-T1-2]WIV66685.1 type 1 glutamine amidotransferase [Natrialbaceae archaeon AArc-T1-2]
MSQLRIAVLNAAHEDANTTRNFRRELEGSLAEFDATASHLPETFDFDAVAITGSRSSVYDDEPWIEPTKAWVADAIDRGLPCLGICWGHQLLADVLGGEVGPMGAYEVGYSEVERHEGSRLLAGIDDRFVAFTSHEDEVVSLPSGADPIATNEYSNHGFRKEHVFGVQFHPEYDQKTARELVHRKEFDEERKRRVLESITPENHARTSQAKLVFENFLEYVREVQTPAVAADGGRDSA